MAKGILIVKDDWAACQKLKHYLEQEGFRVALARDGQAATTAAQLEKPNLSAD
jgi:DNA-binding response OmpR family regulator